MERAKKALRTQWMSNEVQHQDPPNPNLDSESDSDDVDDKGGDDWDNTSGEEGGDQDDWDDWDEEGSAETGNDLISSVLGNFVVSLEGSGVLPGGLQDFSLIDDTDFEALQWSLLKFS